MQLRTSLGALAPVLAAAATSAMAVRALAGPAAGAAQDEQTAVAIWRAPAATAVAGFGGYGYGGAAPGGDAAFVTHQRTVEVGADGGVRLPGVSARIRPATVQFRSLTDAGATVIEQRYAYDLESPEQLLRRHVGRPITVTTTRGQLRGVLRAVDAAMLMLEVGAGADRALEVLRRDGHVLDVQLPIDEDLATEPTLVWKLASRKPGRQSVEVSYRTDGLRWDATYAAILDEAKGALDLSAWATVANDTGLALRAAKLTLVTGTLDAQPAAAPYPGAPVPRDATAAPASFAVVRPVDVPAVGSVQLELFPPRAAVATRRVVVYQPTPDTSLQFQAYPNTDCYGYGTPAGAGSGEAAIEFDAPSRGSVLPEGRVRVFRRRGDGVELLGEDLLRVNAQTGGARLRLGPDDSIAAERKVVDCRLDERTRTLREQVEVTVENKAREPVEVVVREFMVRWVNWKIDAEDLPGTRAAPQAREYRVKLPAGGRRSFTYTTLYSW